MRIVAMPALALAACHGSSDPPEPAPPVVVAAAPVPADAAALADLPPSRRAAIASPPRERWACGFQVEEHQGIDARGTARFHYGKRTSCTLPIALVSQGVWGCPERYDRTDTDGMVRTHPFTYDDHGRLTSFEVRILEGFEWDGDRLSAATRMQWGETDHATYRDRGADEVVAIDDQGRLQEVHELQGGHVVRTDEYVYGRKGASAHIGWRGDRPERVTVEVTGPIRGSVVRTLLYDCAAPE